MTHLDLFSYCIAVAAQLEARGQYNNAKLLRAAVEAHYTKEAYENPLPADLSSSFSEVCSALDIDPWGYPKGFIETLEQGNTAFDDDRLPLYAETPDPFMCRICGHLVLGEAVTVCPTCGADPHTFKRFRAIYWLDDFDPFTALEHLRQAPNKVAALIEGSSEESLGRLPTDEGWSARQAIAHLRDAQGVLQFRVQLMIAQDDPVLESKAVFAWATQEQDRPPTTREIFETYGTARAETIAVLESLPLKDWWRTGRHEEFGQLTLKQQVSYFAAHELTHLPQLKKLVR